MAIKADASTMRSLNKQVESLMNEVASNMQNIDNVLGSVIGNIVHSSASATFENLRAKNLKIASSLSNDMMTLTNFLSKQLDDYEITEQEANNIIDNAIREFDSAKAAFNQNLQNNY